MEVKKRADNLVTLKIEYFTEDVNVEYIRHIQKDFNKVFRFTYNRVCENSKYSTKELTALQSKLNNVCLCKSHLKNSAIYKSRAMYASNSINSTRKVIFGGIKNFVNRCQNKIDKEEFVKNKTLPIYSVGERNRRGNRLFKIINSHTIIFAPDKEHIIQLHLKNVGKNREKQLLRLIELQQIKYIPITYET